MYESLARSVLIDDDPVVRRAVEHVRARHPGLSESDLVRRLIARAAWRGAAVGAAVCVVAGADLAYQTLSLNRLAASIARARRRETTVLERGITAAAGLLVAGSAELLRKGVSRAARRALQRRVPNLLPLISAVAGGAAGYAAAKIFGRVVDDTLAGGRRRRLWTR